MNAASASLLAALCAVGISATASPPAPAPVPGISAGSPSTSWTRQSGVVEDIISSSEGAYQSTAYVVTWNGTRVLVDDPLDAHDSGEGDTLDYLVTRLPTAEGRHLLAFTSLDRRAARPNSTAAPSGRDSTTTATGVVEDVLRAQDGDYHFIAYIARMGDQRAAVWDTLAQSNYAIGDAIPILELRGSSSTGAFLRFQINPERLPQAGISKAQAERATLDTGLVEQVLSAASEGYVSRAYVVRWHGSDALVEDATAASNYQAGDSVQFRILRSPLPGAKGAGIMKLLLEAPPDGPADESAPLQTSSVTETAAVERVLSWQDGADRAVAYLVHWHGVPIAVTDEFATTRFAPGDKIAYSVVRGNDAGGKHLAFVMFVFPQTPLAGRR